MYQKNPLPTLMYATAVEHQKITFIFPYIYISELYSFVIFWFTFMDMTPCESFLLSKNGFSYIYNIYIYNIYI